MLLWLASPMETDPTVSTFPGTAIRRRAILSTNNLKWSYEREWRLFASKRGKAGHIEGAVRHVWLGARMHSSDRRAVTARLKSAGIEVRRTYVDGYSVERRPPPKKRLRR